MMYGDDRLFSCVVLLTSVDKWIEIADSYRRPSRCMRVR
jgi:hypothetical protein